MHPFDRSLASRTLGLAVVLGGLTSGIVVATDEPGSTLSMRIARLAAMIPLVLALAAAVAIGQSKARGEERALESLGATAWQRRRGAAFAGWAVGLVALALVVSPWADVGALFVALPPTSSFEADAGGFVDRVSALRIAPDGSIEWLGVGSGVAGQARLGGLAAALAIGPAAAVVPVWVTSPSGLVAKIAALLASVAVTLVALHAAAAGRLHPAFLILGASPIAAEAAIGHLRKSRA